MLTKFAAALVATGLIASSALATQSTGNSNSTPAAQTSQTPQDHQDRNKARSGQGGYVVTRAREHLASGKDGKSRMERHVRHTAPAKTHQAGVAKAAKRS